MTMGSLANTWPLTVLISTDSEGAKADPFMVSVVVAVETRGNERLHLAVADEFIGQLGRPTALATSDDAMANCMLNFASNAVFGGDCGASASASRR
jgi:hypothetical protein